MMIELVLTVVALACLIALGWNRWHTRQLLRRVDAMLEEATQGSFQERHFDESVYSALESRFADYLSASEISARRVQEERDKIKTLIADISHQTKTPIANILLYAQLLQEQQLPTASADCVAALAGQAEKLQFLNDALVKLSRLEVGVLTLQPTVQSVEPVLREVAQQYQAKAQAKEITLTVEACEAVALFDVKWTTEALGNLVDNAVKYTEPGGAVCLRAQNYELFCRIDVVDNGNGIAEAEQSKIFSRFYRAPQVAQQEGVGVGLYLTRQILASEGGYIKVSSVLGQGTTFSVFLPRP